MATVFLLSGFFSTPDVDLTYQLRGELTLPPSGNTVVNVNYPSFALDSLLIGIGPQVIPDDALVSINTGRDMLDTLLNSTTGPKIVFGHSLGAVVASKWLHDLGPSSPIPASDLSFVFIGNSVSRYGGLLYHPEYSAPASTRYAVKDIKNTYDGWTDFPNVTASPFYGLAVSNAFNGMSTFHLDYTDTALTDPTYPSYTEGQITYIWAPRRPWWLLPFEIPLVEQAYNRPANTPIVIPDPPVLAVSPLKKRYPSNPITRAGASELLLGTKPKFSYRAYDGSIVFELMGPLSYVDTRTPESARVLDLKGLIPPWSNITQKGASQDGVTYVTSLYDEAEVDMTVLLRGRPGEPTRQLVRDWIASWDAKQPGELAWWTQDAGRWWAPVRWGKQPVDSLMGGNWTRQKFGWVIKIYDAFWRSYDSLDEFGFSYAGESDAFDYTTAAGLGAGWTVAYAPTGGGTVHVDGTEIVSALAPNQAMHARRDSFTFATDNQVVSLTIGNISDGWTFPLNAKKYLWARCPATGTPGADGVRLAIGYSSVTLSYFIAGAETVLRTWPLIIPPQSGDKFTLTAGTEGDPRRFTVSRKYLGGSAGGIIADELIGGIIAALGSPIMTVVEADTNSPLGAGYRKGGLGMLADADGFSAGILSWNAGDNVTATQSGFLTRYNVGDQPMWDRFTCIGPGLFKFGNGPGSNDMVSLGPLLDGQVAQVRTDPRRRGVVDLTATAPTAAQQAQGNSGLSDIFGWGAANNAVLSALAAGGIPLNGMLVGGLLGGISPAGVQPPQGNLYATLKGRWSNPIPPKSPGSVAQPYEVKVSIEGGNASSRIIAAGTPLRRYPQ